jgi:hypothetical protein
LERDIPTYVLIEKSVNAEYEVFKRNRENKTIKYASVSSLNVFSFIDYVLSRPRNSPVYHFELSSEIETWLTEQWAGLFRELVRSRSDRVQLSSLADQVADLRNVNATFKRYLEEIVAAVGNKEQAKEIINEEKVRLSETRERNELSKLSAIQGLMKTWDTPLETARSLFSDATSLDDLARRLQSLTKGSTNPIVSTELVGFWKDNPDMAEKMNEVRETLHLPRLEFVSPDQRSNSKKSSKDRSKRRSG